MDAECRIVVITERETVKEQLKNVLDHFSKVDYLLPSEVRNTLSQFTPDIVLLYEPLDGSSVELISYIMSEKKGIHLIFLANHEDFELLRETIRAGAVEFFVWPGELTAFTERMDKLTEMIKHRQGEGNSTSQQNFKRGRGKVCCLYSGKGGSGKTLLASGFAQTMRLESTADILLIDLNLQFGGIETFLSMESNRSLADLQPVIDELNENHIHSVTEKEKYSHLELLLSPKDVETGETITEDFVIKLLRAARRYYDFVIVDLPVTMNEVTFAALQESDVIYYVIQLDTPSIRILKTVEDLCRQLHLELKERLELVVNNIGRDNELKVSDLKNLTAFPIAAEIHRDHKAVQTAVNQGEPLRKEQREKKLSQVSKDLRKWVLKKLK